MVTDFVNDNKIPSVKRTAWVDYLLRPAIITIMIACLSFSLINLVKVINPTWHGSYFFIGMILISIEAIYSFLVFKRYRQEHAHISPLRYRAVEWGVLILLLKILTYSNKSWQFIKTDLSELASHPLQFLNPEFFIFLLLAIFAWGAATQTIQDFENLYDPFTFRSATIVPLNNLIMRFFWGGGLLVFISGLSIAISNTGWTGLLDIGRSQSSGIIINVLIYFMLGLVMLSQAQLTMLLTRWSLQKVKITSGLVKRWTKYGIILLSIITFLVLLLPTRYTIGFLGSVGFVIQIIANVIVFLLQLLLLIISIPILWLSSFFGIEPPNDEINPQSTMLDFGDFVNQQTTATYSWLEIIQSIAFWVVVIVIIWYLVKTYLQDHPELLQWFRKFKSFRFLLHWLTQLWHWVKGTIKSGIALLPKKQPLTQVKEKSPTTKKWRWPSLGNMSAREQILYYYLNTLKQSEKLGTVRPKSDTPTEFEPKLRKIAPNVDAEINLLTQAFVRARYSKESFDSEQAKLVKTIWQRIYKVLKNSTPK